MFIQHSVAEARAGRVVVRELMTGRHELNSFLSFGDPTSLLHRMVMFPSAEAVPLQRNKKKLIGLEGYRK